MAQIPLYKQKIAPTTQIGSAPADVRSAAAPFKALAQLGNVASGVAFDYAKRRKDLKEKADRSDYRVELQNFQTQLIEAKSAAQQSGVGYQDMYGEVVAPAMEQFGSKLEKRGYSKAAMRDIQEQWNFDSSSIAQSEAVEREKMEIADYTHRIQTDADTILSSGDFEGADAKYDELASVVGEKAVSRMKSLGRYNYYTISQQGLESNRLDGLIDDEQYFAGLQDLKAEAKSSGMEMNHSKAIEINTNAKILNFKGKRVQGRDKAINQFKKLRDRDEVTVASLEELELMAGDIWSDALESTINSSLSVKATSDKDADKVYQAVVDTQNGKISIGAGLSRAEKVGGQHAEMGIYLLGRIAEDQANGDGSVIAYDNNWNGVPSKITSTTTDFVENLGFYMSAQEEGKRAGYFAQKFMAYDNWREQNPQVKDEDYIIWRNETFKKDATDMVQSLNAPQVPIIETEYKEGHTRTHPVTGITYTLKDGRWQE